MTRLVEVAATEIGHVAVEQAGAGDSTTSSTTLAGL